MLASSDASLSEALSGLPVTGEMTVGDLRLRISEVATDLGSHVEQQVLPGALHDVWLSRPPVREAAYDHMVRWLSAVFSD